MSKAGVCGLAETLLIYAMVRVGVYLRVLRLAVRWGICLRMFYLLSGLRISYWMIRLL